MKKKKIIIIVIFTAVIIGFLLIYNKKVKVKEPEDYYTNKNGEVNQINFEVYNSGDTDPQHYASYMPDWYNEQAREIKNNCNAYQKIKGDKSFVIDIIKQCKTEKDLYELMRAYKNLGTHFGMPDDDWAVLEVFLQFLRINFTQKEFEQINSVISNNKINFQFNYFD